MSFEHVGQVLEVASNPCVCSQDIDDETSCVAIANRLLLILIVGYI